MTQLGAQLAEYPHLIDARRQPHRQRDIDAVARPPCRIPPRHISRIRRAHGKEPEPITRRWRGNPLPTDREHAGRRDRWRRHTQRGSVCSQRERVAQGIALLHAELSEYAHLVDARSQSGWQRDHDAVTASGRRVPPGHICGVRRAHRIESEPIAGRRSGDSLPTDRERAVGRDCRRRHTQRSPARRHGEAIARGIALLHAVRSKHAHLIEAWRQGLWQRDDEAVAGFSSGVPPRHIPGILRA